MPCLVLCFMLPFCMLQFCLGNIDTSFLAFPVGEAVGGAVVLLLWVLNNEKGESKWMRELRSARLACWLLGLIGAYCVVGGSVPAMSDFTASWPFAALMVALCINLLLALFHRLQWGRLRRDAAFLCVHGGLALALISSLVGTADTLELKALVTQNDNVSVASDRDGRLIPLDYNLRLQHFDVEKSNDGGFATQYRATVLIDDVPTSISVNNPKSMGISEDIYLTHFDTRAPEGQVSYCILTIVRQPWKYAILTGIVLLMAGVLRYLFALAVVGRDDRKEVEV